MSTEPNLISDIFYKGVLNPGRIDAAMKKLSPDALDLVDGYAKGFNRALREQTAAGLPGECRGAAWVRPVEAKDVFKVTYVQILIGGIYNLAAEIASATPPSTGQAVPALLPQEQLGRLSATSQTSPGSNAYAFGRDVTDNGRGVLLGNPHLLMFGTDRWFMLHATIPGRLDVMGAVLGASPVVNIGFNKDVAWSHTFAKPYTYSFHQLNLGSSPTTYRVDGKEEAMTQRMIAIEALQADGSLKTVNRAIYETRYGPVLVSPSLGMGWSSGVAYAIRDANLENYRAIDQWLAMGEAKNVRHIERSLDTIAGIPWANTIAADRHGKVFFETPSVVPNVSFEDTQRCVTSGLGRVLLAATNLHVLDGSRSDCDWKVDKKTPQPGIMPQSSRPSLLRNDWVHNSNDGHWLTNPAEPLTGFAPIFNENFAARTLRTRLAIVQVNDRFAGRDGLAGRQVGLDQVMAIFDQNRNYAGEAFLNDFLAVCQGTVTISGVVVDLDEPCAVLAAWDRRNAVGSAGMPLFREFWKRAVQIPGLYAIAYDKANPLTTPRLLATANGDVLSRLREAFGQTVLQFRTFGIPLAARLGDVQYLLKGNRPIPIPGSTNAEGAFNITETLPFSPNGLPAVFGAGYVQAVTFDDKGPVARALLSYSQSSDPASANFADMTGKYSRSEWASLPFTERDINADAASGVIRIDE